MKFLDFHLHQHQSVAHVAIIYIDAEAQQYIIYIRQIVLQFTLTPQ